MSHDLFLIMCENICKEILLYIWHREQINICIRLEGRNETNFWILSTNVSFSYEYLYLTVFYFCVEDLLKWVSLIPMRSAKKNQLVSLERMSWILFFNKEEFPLWEEEKTSTWWDVKSKVQKNFEGRKKSTWGKKKKIYKMGC